MNITQSKSTTNIANLLNVLKVNNEKTDICFRERYLLRLKFQSFIQSSIQLRNFNHSFNQPNIQFIRSQGTKQGTKHSIH